MEKLNKTWVTRASVLMAVVLSSGVMGSFFIPPIRRLQNDMLRAEKVLEVDQALLARKPMLQAEWEAKKNFFNQGLQPDAVLNAWVKELLASAQSQSLSLEKIEPAGNQSVFVSFRGDIRKFIQFIYQILDRDPVSRVESVDIRREEDSQNFVFDLTLGKVMK